MSRDHLIPYDVRVLGSITVEGPDGPVDPGGRKPCLLFALLVAHAGSVVTTERLIDGLWGDQPPATARKTLQVHVSTLRRNLGGSAFPLETARAGYLLDATQLTIDAARFEDDVRRGSALRESEPAEASALLAAALARWTGPAYADVADEEAIRPEATRLDELRLSAVERRLDSELRLGHHELILGELEAVAADHPYRERLRALHMVALYRAGRQTDALRAFDWTRRTLADELGIEPSPELRHVHQQVLEQAAQLDLDMTRAAPVFAAGSVDVAVPARSEACAAAWSVRGYELRERLGERDGVAVHRAYQASVGREVAIKLIPAATANDAAFVKRFEADCRIVAELEHPHIVSVYDYWRDPDGAYVVMPLLRGGTLERSLEHGPWDATAALQLVEQIGSALSCAHRRGVVHGDLRPSNVILDGDRNAYLSDFLLHEALPRSVTQGSVFTSPEMSAGEAIGPAADVYGLAVLTCAVLADGPPGEVAFSPIDLPPAFGDVVRQATDCEPLRRFDSVDAYLQALRRAFGADGVGSGAPPLALANRNPYKGLRPFGETDAADFFGRDDLVIELVDRVSRNNLTAVVGPSGSGKSSLVRAGLVPAVRRGALGGGREFVIAEMFPGSYPFEELESALLRVAVDRPVDLLADLSDDDRGLMRVSKQILPGDHIDLLLVIDQFEELFALSAGESVRRDFIASLVTVATDEQSRVRVVLTLRADFYDRPLNYPAFGELVKGSMTTVTLPGEGRLAEAIGEPARRVGLGVEPGLIPTILRDVVNEPGALPLLQYALTELADGCGGDVMTIDGYRRTGGVVGALARRAEEIFMELSPSGRDVARELFVRLVNVSDEADDTRRRVRRTELEGLGIDPQSLNRVIGAFGSFRLLSFDHDPVTRGPTVEVAHEALIREWPRYRTWIADRRDDLRTERRLETAVAEWRGGDRDSSLLISGGRLERYERWMDSSDVRLTADQRAFVAESRRQELARRAATSRRRRRVLAALSVLAALAVVAAMIAVVQRNRADDQAQAATDAATSAEDLRVEAERESLVNRSQALMASAAAENDPELRVLLALAAHDALQEAGLQDPAVTSALYQFTFDQAIERRLPMPTSSGTRPLDIHPSPDGTMFVATSYAGRVWVVDVRSGAMLSTLDLDVGTAYSRSVKAAWDADDGLIMTGLRGAGTIERWKPTGEWVDSIPAPHGRSVEPLFAHDGLLGYGRYGVSFNGLFEVVVVDRATGDVVFETDQTAVNAVLSPDGRYLMIDEYDAGVRVYETGTWEDVTPDELRADTRTALVADVSWAANGDALWLLEQGVLTEVLVSTGETVATIATRLPRAVFVAESADGRLVATGGGGAPVHVFDVATRQLVVELAASARSFDLVPTYDSAVDEASWVMDGRIVLADEQGATIWNLGTPNAAAAVWPRIDRAPSETGVTSSGDVLFGYGDGTVERFDAAGALRRTFEGVGTPAVQAVLSADGRALAVPAGDRVDIVDAATGARRATGPAGFDRPLGLSTDGQRLVVGTAFDADDHRHLVTIVDVGTGAVRRVASLADGERAAFTSDGRFVVIPIARVQVSSQGAALTGLWVVDTSTGATISRGPPESCMTAVAVSSDDALAATVGCRGAVSLFDMETLRGSASSTALIGGDLDDHTAGVGVTFGPDDETVIVTRQDGRVEAYSADADFDRLWSFDVGDFVGMPSVRDGMVWVGVTSPYVLSGGAIAMPLDLDELVAFARDSTTRELTDQECQEYLDRPTCAVA